MPLAMTKHECEVFLADVHVGGISIPEPGGPLTVPVWYSYEPGEELWVVTARTSRKGQQLTRAGRFELCSNRRRALQVRERRGHHRRHRGRESWIGIVEPGGVDGQPTEIARGHPEPQGNPARTYDWVY